jgi:hypothetical protein
MAICNSGILCFTLAASTALLTSPARAVGDKIVFPEAFDKDTLYAVVDRHDVKQYRELYASKEAVEAVRKGQPIPSCTVLTLVQYKAVADAQGNPARDANGRFQKGDLIAYTVMEKRKGWGTEYGDDIRNGEWDAVVSGPDGKSTTRQLRAASSATSRTRARTVIRSPAQQHVPQCNLSRRSRVRASSAFRLCWAGKDRGQAGTIDLVDEHR